MRAGSWSHVHLKEATKHRPQLSSEVAKTHWNVLTLLCWSFCGAVLADSGCKYRILGPGRAHFIKASSSGSFEHRIETQFYQRHSRFSGSYNVILTSPSVMASIRPSFVKVNKTLLEELIA
jgi:hypothetical protein